MDCLLNTDTCNSLSVCINQFHKWTVMPWWSSLSLAHTHTNLKLLCFTSANKSILWPVFRTLPSCLLVELFQKQYPHRWFLLAASWRTSCDGPMYSTTVIYRRRHEEYFYVANVLSTICAMNHKKNHFIASRVSSRTHSRRFMDNLFMDSKVAFKANVVENRNIHSEVFTSQCLYLP